MAQFVGKIVAGDEKKGILPTIREDKFGRPFAGVQDRETNQFLTVYEKKGSDVDLSTLEVGSLVLFSGTVHPLYKGVKMIATSIEVVKPAK